MCICNPRYPACNAHASYCNLWPVRLYYIFPHYLIKGKIFWKKMLFRTKCVFWFSLQLLSETFLIIRRTERDMIKNVYWSSCKVPVILVRFEWNLIFSTVFFFKNTQIPNLMKIRPVRADFFFHGGRRTDMKKLTTSFGNYANVSNDWLRNSASKLRFNRNRVRTVFSTFHIKYKRFAHISLNCPPSTRDLLHNISCVKFSHKICPIAPVHNTWHHKLHHWHFS